MPDTSHDVATPTVPELGLAAFRSPLGVFAKSPPCSPTNYQGCAGDSTAISTAPMQMGNPMAQPGLGVPVGGIGAGAFMINQAGTFGPWHMGGSQAINYENRILPQAAFHLRSETHASAAQVHTLAVNTSQFGSVLPAWHTLQPGRATYRGLYPFGQIDYGEVQNGIRARLDFWSPIVPRDEELSSQPVAYFDITLHNTRRVPTAVAAMLTFPNAPAHVADTVQNTPSTILSNRTGFSSEYILDEVTGVSAVSLHAAHPTNTPDADDTEWTLAARPDAGQQVSFVTSWNADGDGSDIVAAFSGTGTLPNVGIDSSNSAAALAVSTNLDAGASTVIRFALAWDFPRVTYGADHGTTWMRRYTSFYGGTQDEKNDYIHGSYSERQGFAIANRNLVNREAALTRVLHWWNPIAGDASIPPAVRMAALNELNQLAFNGAFWESGLVETNVSPTAGARIGSLNRGLHLYNSVTGGGWGDAGELNVHGQATWVTRELFPEIEAGWVRAYAQMIAQNPSGRVPDSPGNTEESPWLSWTANEEAAVPQDVFIDTPLKFLTRAYAAYVASGDETLLRDAYPSMLRTWIYDVEPRIPAGKSFPTNPGLLANTYDVVGEDEGSVGVYVAALYMLGLEIMIQATRDAKRLGLPAAAAVGLETMIDTRAAARQRFEDTFWTGSYYQFTDGGAMATDVFADTMWPQYQAERMGLPDLHPSDRIIQHMRTAYPILTQLKDSSGRIIGMPNAVPVADEPYRIFTNTAGFQKAEVWTGANYAIAAQYLRAGQRFGCRDLVEAGHELGEAIVYQAWDSHAAAEGSYAFNTPESWNGYDPKTYRSPNYIRVLAVWDLLRAHQDLTRSQGFGR